MGFGITYSGNVGCDHI